MTIHNSLSELIGNTPLVKLNHVTDGIKATIAVKVEYLNPGGSSKAVSYTHLTLPTNSRV